MQNKGSLAEQPFIYIMGIVVTVLILAFGFRSITQLKEEASLVQVSTFITDLSRIIETYYNLNVGSSRDLSLAVPESIKMICFTNPHKEATADVSQEIAFILEGSENIYLFNGRLGPRTIPHLEVNPEENPTCFQTSGRLIATIETKARERQVYVEVSK